MVALQPNAFASAPSLTIDWWSDAGSYGVGLDDPDYGCGVSSHVQSGIAHMCAHITHAQAVCGRSIQRTITPRERAFLVRMDQLRRWHVPDAGLRHPLKLPAPGPPAANQR